MRISVPRRVLDDALVSAGKVASGRSSLPILGHVLLQAGEGLSVRASNLEQQITLALHGAVVQEPGSLLLSLAVVRSLVSEIREGELTIAGEDGKEAVVERPGFDYHLRVLPSADFPELKAPGEGCPTLTVAAASDNSATLTINGSVNLLTDNDADFGIDQHDVNDDAKRVWLMA